MFVLGINFDKNDIDKAEIVSYNDIDNILTKIDKRDNFKSIRIDSLGFLYDNKMNKKENK